MDPHTQLVPGYYVWDVPGQPAVVYLSLEALDRLEAEVLRGFGSIPKRGAEVGGVLLGSVEPGAGMDGRTVVRIRDFQPVACTYKRGPAYLLDEDESRNFQEACTHWKPDPAQSTGAVGYYRSHTRDQAGLDAEDLARMDRCFPEAEAVALLVRPYATTASVAGFFLRENGAFPAAPRLEFPLNRADLTGVEPAMRRPVFERPAPLPPPVPEPDTPREDAGPDRTPAGLMYEPSELDALETAVYRESSPSFRGGWVWLPLSFLFLLLGVFLGFQLALVWGPRAAAPAAGNEFALGLTVARTDDNLSVRWNRDAPAILSAQKGLLEIEDGGYAKPVDLDQGHLRNGSIVYRYGSANVRFRLIVYLNPRLTVTETINWSQ